jgi:hypothetical protein
MKPSRRLDLAQARLLEWDSYPALYEQTYPLYVASQRVIRTWEKMPNEDSPDFNHYLWFDLTLDLWHLKKILDQIQIGIRE